MRVMWRSLTVAAMSVAALAVFSPAQALAGSVSGTVTDAATHGAIAGIQVCANSNPDNYEGICTETTADGTYQIVGVPAGSYSVRFASYRQDLNYVAEWSGGDHARPGDLVSVGTGDVSGIDAELEVGGVITGTLTDAETGGPAAGALACVENQDIFFGICLKADANGNYEVNRLATAEYRVSFEGDNEANYLNRYYDETDYSPQADPVSVVAGSEVDGIDAVLTPGAQILGHVSQGGTGAPLADVWVCAEEPAPGDVTRCDFTDEAGDYAIRSLPAGTYLVAFDPEPLPFGVSAVQWWQGASTAAEATPIAIAPPETRTGIDGVIDQPTWGPEPSSEPLQAVTATTLPILAAPRPTLRKCRKGSHRKLVKGKKRCVRKQRRHRSHQHRLGAKR